MINHTANAASAHRGESGMSRRQGQYRRTGRREISLRPLPYYWVSSQMRVMRCRRAWLLLGQSGCVTEQLILLTRSGLNVSELFVTSPRVAASHNHKSSGGKYRTFSLQKNGNRNNGQTCLYNT